MDDFFSKFHADFLASRTPASIALTDAVIAESEDFLATVEATQGKSVRDFVSESAELLMALRCITRAVSPKGEDGNMLTMLLMTIAIRASDMCRLVFIPDASAEQYEEYFLLVTSLADMRERMVDRALNSPAK